MLFDTIEEIYHNMVLSLVNFIRLSDKFPFGDALHKIIWCGLTISGLSPFQMKWAVRDIISLNHDITIYASELFDTNVTKYFDDNQHVHMKNLVSCSLLLKWLCLTI